MPCLRRHSIVTLLLAVVFLGVCTTPSQAQEATPTPEIINRTFETLGIVNDLSLAPGLTLQLERYTWLPGVVTEMHTHPAEIDIMYIQSGEIAWSVENGEAQITRTAVDGAPGASETLSPGAEVTLHAGDSVVFDYTAGLQHKGSVVGDAPAVMLVAHVHDPAKQS
jgi:mannose-6-phosphate isomerase-like protein (cupin superfamily)